MGRSGKKDFNIEKMSCCSFATRRMPDAASSLKASTFKAQSGTLNRFNIALSIYNFQII